MSRPITPHWRDEALCRQTDPEIFFPELGQNPTAAKRVCAVCPVRAVCLADAIERREPHGVCGGMTPNERKAYARAQQSVRRSNERWAA
jgi:hypothetical protein